MAGSLPAINLEDFDDLVTREHWKRLLDFFKAETPLLGFRFFELTFTATQTNFKFRHNIGSIPKDIIQTSITGSGVVTFNYALFTAETLDLTVSAACVVRFFAGIYNASP